jgi:hypothetical protein
MPPSQRSNEIYTAFYLFAKGDKKQPVGFSLEELKFVLVEYSKDNGTQAYKAIELKAAELERKLGETRERREKWTFLFLGFLLTILAAILAQLLLRQYF